MPLHENDQVIILPEIMQDQTVKSNHHLFKRIIASKEVGTIRELDVEKSEDQNANLFWVQFHVAAIRIDEKYLELTGEEILQ
jgi:hypothetical protein